MLTNQQQKGRTSLVSNEVRPSQILNDSNYIKLSRESLFGPGITMDVISIGLPKSWQVRIYEL
jgi:hypothetical protein